MRCSRLIRLDQEPDSWCFKGSGLPIPLKWIFYNGEDKLLYFLLNGFVSRLFPVVQILNCLWSIDYFHKSSRAILTPLPFLTSSRPSRIFLTNSGSYGLSEALVSKSIFNALAKALIASSCVLFFGRISMVSIIQKY